MKQTPLHQAHIDANAKMVDFGGWHMPVQYVGIAQEHKAVREQVGLFDVSHMGEFWVEGEDAEKYLNYLLTNNVTRITDGQAMYTVMCQEDGGIIDDLIVYRLNPQRFLMVVNAANIEKDFAWAQKHAESFAVDLRNASDEFCQIALQGPQAEAVLRKIVPESAAAIKPFRFVESDLLGTTAIIARTGYTGEDGYEIYAPAQKGMEIWQALLEAGKAAGIQPCGLGARDTLRLEAALALYGNDISTETNPIEANLGWVVKLKKGDFVGREALQAIKDAGPARRLHGLKPLDRVIPRQHYDVFSESGEQKIGTVTSGTLSPTLGCPIAMAYIQSGAQTGDTVSIAVRGKQYRAEVVELPFYRCKKEQ